MVVGVCEKTGTLEIRREAQMKPQEDVLTRIAFMRGTSLNLVDAFIISDLSNWDFRKVTIANWLETDFAQSRLLGTLNVAIVNGEPVRLKPGSKELNDRIMLLLRMLQRNTTYPESDLAKSFKENCDPNFKESIYGDDSNPIIVHDRAYL